MFGSKSPEPGSQFWQRNTGINIKGKFWELKSADDFFQTQFIYFKIEFSYNLKFLK